MRTLSDGMQAHLDGGVTTLCYCWKLTRKDGAILGFTDHDEDVRFDDVIYLAATGFTASSIQNDLGLNTTSIDVTGALRSDQLTEEDLSKGLWDNADIELYRVNWQQPDMNVIMRKGTIGEVTRDQLTFTAELRGLSYALNQVQGRLYSYMCDAVLGDSRCGVDLSSPTFHGSGSVSKILGEDRWFLTSGLSSFASDWFTGGKVTFTSGENTGATAEIRLHVKDSFGIQIELWMPMGAAVSVSDTFDVTAGCDHLFNTCKTKFNNAINFRGFPWMPSNDRVTAYPDPDAISDGSSLFGN